MDLQLSDPGSALIDGNTSWNAVAENALSIWNTYLSPVQFTVYSVSQGQPGDGDGINQVFFSTDVYGQAFGARVLAVTSTWRIGTKRTEGDTLFNSVPSWNSYRGPLRQAAAGAQLFDLERVALHEFGHTLGLDHPDDAGQVVVAQMNSTVSDLDALAQDDIDGAQALYPAAAQQPPSIATQQQSQTVSPGDSVSFSVVASGSATLTYQWKHDGNDVPGATDSVLSLSNVGAGDTGNYTVLVTNSKGSVLSDAAVLSFPFVPIQGNYSGLFYETNGVSQQSSGFFTLSTTAKGKFSGRLQIGMTRYTMTGQLDASGAAQLTLSARNSPSVSVSLQIDADDPDRITGTVSGGTWAAGLSGDRLVFNKRTNPSSNAGQFTLVIPGNHGSTTEPGGDSYGTVTVDQSGGIRFAASLADGTKITQTATLSKDGQWPLYIALYKGTGLQVGWIGFADQPGDDLSGDLVWIKPAIASSKYYPAGFQTGVTATGSKYVRPAIGVQILNLSHGTFTLNGLNAGEIISDTISLDSKNKLTTTSADKLRVTFTPTTGLWRGTVLNSATSKPISFSGVVLQRHNTAGGFFLGTGESGWISLAPIAVISTQ